MGFQHDLGSNFHQPYYAGRDWQALESKIIKGTQLEKDVFRLHFP